MGRTVYLPIYIYHKKSTIHVGNYSYTWILWVIFIEFDQIFLYVFFQNFCSAPMAGKADAAGLPVFRVMKIIGLLRGVQGEGVP